MKIFYIILEFIIGPQCRHTTGSEEFLSRYERCWQDSPPASRSLRPSALLLFPFPCFSPPPVTSYLLALPTCPLIMCYFPLTSFSPSPRFSRLTVTSYILLSSTCPLSSYVFSLPLSYCLSLILTRSSFSLLHFVSSSFSSDLSPVLVSTFHLQLILPTTSSSSSQLSGLPQQRPFRTLYHWN